MAASREPRCNAGNRMSRLLEGELDEDDFYKTTYGGFAEEEEDIDFKTDEEDSADDVDSDFDRSEDDEIKSEEEDVDKPKQRKRGIFTKAYKEPAVKKTKSNTSNTASMTPSNVPADASELRKTETLKDIPLRKSTRKATANNSLMTTIRRKEREESDKKKKETAKKPLVGYRRLTQEELMKIAEKTERKNLKSLQKYQLLEANRKKVFVKKKTYDGPTITYLSTTMLKKNEDDNEPKKRVDDAPCTVTAEDKHSRNFIIYSSDKNFKEAFKHRRCRPPPKAYCPVTRKLAKYVDPLTRLPYYDMNAFKIIRKTYHETIEELKTKTTLN